jgi:hypothetical protein
MGSKLEKIKARVKKFMSTLSAKIGWGVVTGIIQAITRFLVDALGWPAFISMLFVTGAGAAMSLLTNIEPAWIWFTTVVVIFLGLPSIIRESREYRRASAELLIAANQNQEPLQQEAINQGKQQLNTGVQRLEQLYDEGRRLLPKNKTNPAEWRNKIREWFDRSEDAVNEDVPKEAFMYRTLCNKPSPRERFDDCAILLAQ